MSMTQEQINVSLFDEVKRLQRENTKLREALKWAEPYVPQVCETRRMIDELKEENKSTGGSQNE